MLRGGKLSRREGRRREGEGERERESGRKKDSTVCYIFIGGYSAIGWNHPGFGDSSVSLLVLC